MKDIQSFDTTSGYLIKKCKKFAVQLRLGTESSFGRETFDADFTRA